MSSDSRSIICECGLVASSIAELDDHQGKTGHFMISRSADGWTRVVQPIPRQIDHPSYYGGDTTYEAIKVIEAWGLGFCLGNAIKYISRAGKKDPAKLVEDLEKARWYLDREIAHAKKGTSP